MADGNQKKALQAAHSSKHVGYGQFGTATYHSESTSWSFLHEPQSIVQDATSHEYLSHPFSLLQGPKLLLRGTDDLKTPEAFRNSKSSQVFLRHAPEVADSAIQYAADLGARKSFNDKAHPNTSFLEFGSALLLGSGDNQSGFQTTPLAAWVKSSRSDQLVLVLLGRDEIRIESDFYATRRFVCPVISGSQSVSWSSGGDPIKHIKFSGQSSLRKDTWLVVQRSSGVDVFQPLLHRSKTVLNSDRTSSDSLDSNHIMSIPCTRTGGSSLAHVSLHPQNPQQLACIDMEGNWSVWTIEGKKSRSAHVLYRAVLNSHGQVSPQQSPFSQPDGWYKINWMRVGRIAVDHLLICSRQSITLTNLSCSDRLELDCRVGSRRPEPIIDLVQAASYNTCFVLTASYVFYLKAHKKPKQEKANRATLGVIAYWDHFRGHGDVSLRMDAMHYRSGTLLFLSSANNSVVTACQISDVAVSEATSSVVKDTILLKVPSSVTDRYKYLKFQPVATEVLSSTPSFARQSLFKLFVQDTNGGLQEFLYEIQSLNDSQNDAINPTPLPRSRLLRHRSDYRVSDDADEAMDDFVVADDAIDLKEDTRLVETDTVLSQIAGLTLENMPAHIRPLTHNFEQLYKDTSSSMLLTDKKIEQGLERLLHGLERMIDAHVSDAEPSLTLLDASETLPYVAEIEEDSQKLKKWFLSMSNSGNMLHRLQHIDNSELTVQRSLEDVYNELAELWMPSLPTLISDRFRVQRERLLRQIALELYLANISIRRAPVRFSDLAHKAVQLSHDAQVESSTQSLRDEEFVLPSSSQITKSSNTTGGTTFATLSSLTTFQKPTPPSNRSAAIIENILAHLPTSHEQDPLSYSYGNVELNLALAHNQTNYEELDGKARRKAEKLARAQRRQMDKQSQIKKVAFEQTSAVPAIMSSQLPIRAIQSSQDAIPESSQLRSDDLLQFNMTQPERGAHGTKDNRKKKIKSKATRQKGF